MELTLSAEEQEFLSNILEQCHRELLNEMRTRITASSNRGCLRTRNSSIPWFVACGEQQCRNFVGDSSSSVNRDGDH